MSMPVFKVAEGGNMEVVFIELEDVLFFTVNKSKLYVQTTEGLYHLPSSLEDCALIEGFEKLDRPYVVQTKHIEHMDDKYNIVYFGPDRRYQCTVSSANMQKARALVRDRVKIQIAPSKGSPHAT